MKMMTTMKMTTTTMMMMNEDFVVSHRIVTYFLTYPSRHLLYPLILLFLSSYVVLTVNYEEWLDKSAN